MKRFKNKIGFRSNLKKAFVKLLSLEDPTIYDLLLNKISSKDIAVNEIADMIRNMSLNQN